MNPTVAMILNIAATFVSGGVAAVSATAASGSSVAMWAGIVGAVFGGINTAMHATSTARPGPLA